MIKNTVAIIFTGESILGGGGAERRFLRAWKSLNTQELPFRLLLVINNKLFKSAMDSGVISESRDNLIIISDTSKLQQSVEIISVIKKYRIQIVHLPLLQKSLLPLYIYLFWNRRRLKTTQTIALSTLAHGLEKDSLLNLLNIIASMTADRIDSLYYSLLQNPKYRKYRDKITVTPCSFTDYEKYSYDSDKKTKTILFCSRLIPEKNPQIFVEAANILKGFTEWHFVICGDGPLLFDLKNQVKQLDLNDRVRFTKVGDTSKLFQSASIFASIQSTENYPSQSLLEAMASGAAVVATDVGDTSRIIVDHHTGLLIDVNSENLASAIKNLIEDTTLRTSIATAAQMFVIEHHTLEKFQDYLKRLWKYD